jgi:hypothetical protein
MPSNSCRLQVAGAGGGGEEVRAWVSLRDGCAGHRSRRRRQERRALRRATLIDRCGHGRAEAATPRDNHKKGKETDVIPMPEGCTPVLGALDKQSSGAGHHRGGSAAAVTIRCRGLATVWLPMAAKDSGRFLIHML